MSEIIELTGVIGYPTSKNLSAFMHNAGFKKLNLDYLYLLLEVKPSDLEDAIKGIKAMNFKGFNVTVPYKEKVLPFIDQLTPAADEIGAVNTVWKNEKGKLIGDNTDGKGCIIALKGEKNFNPAGKKVFLLGAGGAGKAIAIMLARENVGELNISDIDITKAYVLLERINKINDGLKSRVIDANNQQEMKKIIRNVDIFINATPVGMYNEPDRVPVPIEILHSDLLVYDIINNPYETKLLQLAAKIGADTLNGLPMLAYQGLEGFKRWTGKEISVEVFKQAARDEVEEYSFFSENKNSGKD